MTVEDTLPAQTYNYSGPGNYPFSFEVQLASDLVVNYYDTDGNLTLLVLDVDYTVTLSDPGGTVHTLYVATDGLLEILRILPIEQNTRWPNNNPFNAEQLEDDLDRIVMILQQQDVQQGSSVSGPPGISITLPVPAEGKGLKWEANDLVNTTYDIDTQQEAAEQAAEDAEASAQQAEFYASISASKVDTIPIGTILPWIGGYFTDSSNGGFTNVLGNTEIEIKTLLNGTSFALCNGDTLEDADSPIFDQPGRFLPRLTDDRFLMGSGGAGVVGGSNLDEHTHQTSDFTLTLDHIPSHAHAVGTGSGRPLVEIGAGAGAGIAVGTNYFVGAASASTNSVGGGLTHAHGPTQGPSETENRPLYLTSWFIMKFKYDEIPEDYEYYAVKKVTP